VDTTVIALCAAPLSPAHDYHPSLHLIHTFHQGPKLLKKISLYALAQESMQSLTLKIATVKTIYFLFNPSSLRFISLLGSFVKI
jgi:hypothetical protein